MFSIEWQNDLQKIDCSIMILKECAIYFDDKKGIFIYTWKDATAHFHISIQKL